MSYGSEPTNKGNEDDSDSLPDENGMQTLKNCDCFSTFNGSVYLLGGSEFYFLLIKKKTVFKL